MVGIANNIWNATQVANNVSSAAKMMDQSIPEIVLAGKSIASSANRAAYAAAFASVISTVGTFGELAFAYQGTEALNRIAGHLGDISRSSAAHVGLIAPRKFAQIVIDFINEKLHLYRDSNRTEHAFFVYHPDTDWTSAFSAILREKGLDDPEGRYRGRTSNLDLAIIMMLETRAREKEKESGKTLELHLIIPAYTHMVIEEAISLPEDLGQVIIHGKRHRSTEYVWINLPEEQASFLDGIRILNPGQSWGELITSWLPGKWGASADSPRRDLGFHPSDPRGAGYESDKATDGSGHSDSQDDKGRYARDSRRRSTPKRRGSRNQDRSRGPGRTNREDCGTPSFRRGGFD